MVHMMVMLDEDVYAAAQKRAKDLGTSIDGLVLGYLKSLANGNAPEPRIEDEHREVDWGNEKLKEVLADFERRGVGLDMSENQTREEMYDEARKRPDAVC